MVARVCPLTKVQAALALQAEEACVFLAHSGLPGARRMDVADREIATLPQRVIGQAIVLQLLPHIAVGPVGNRMELPAAGAQFEEIERATLRGLGAAQAGNPG